MQYDLASAINRLSRALRSVRLKHPLGCGSIWRIHSAHTGAVANWTKVQLVPQAVRVFIALTSIVQAV